MRTFAFLAIVGDVLLDFAQVQAFLTGRQALLDQLRINIVEDDPLENVFRLVA